MRRRLPPSVLAVICLAIVLAAVWQPHDPDAVDLLLRHAGPSLIHPLGTDHLGRDVLSRLMVGAGHTATVLVVVTVVSALTGTLIGVIAALSGRLVEGALVRAAEFVIVMPQLVLALTLTTLVGLTPVTAGVALGVAGWGSYAMLAHHLTTRVLAQDYMRAAEALGAGTWGKLRRHVLPSIRDTVSTYLGSDAGRNVLSYAALAFLGLGADTSRPDWGAMVHEYRLFLFDNPVLLLWPTLAITVTAAILNLVFDAGDEVERLLRR
ncbi:MAG: ABC transporter permease [Pseudomonadota bacterium]